MVTQCDLTLVPEQKRVSVNLCASGTRNEAVKVP